MGCDIHAYIEYRMHDAYQDHPAFYTCFAENVELGRNYLLFALMADVRNESDNPVKPIAKPRGLPEDISMWVDWQNSLTITDSGDADETCTLEQATRWVQHGDSEWTSERHTSVTHPDYHSHSWLTFEELREVQARYLENVSPATDQYLYLKAILALMSVLEEDKPESTRLVFWFDN